MTLSHSLTCLLWLLEPDAGLSLPLLHVGCSSRTASLFPHHDQLQALARRAYAWPGVRLCPQPEEAHGTQDQHATWGRKSENGRGWAWWNGQDAATARRHAESAGMRCASSYQHPLCVCVCVCYTDEIQQYCSQPASSSHCFPGSFRLQLSRCYLYHSSCCWFWPRSNLRQLCAAVGPSRTTATEADYWGTALQANLLLAPRTYWKDHRYRSLRAVLLNLYPL